MFRKSKDEQISIFDRYLTANKQTSKAVDNSVAKLVGDIIYPNVDEERFAPLFSSDNNSRPNIEIRRYVSALILKRLYRMSDANLIEFLRCGAVNFQYALHTTGQDLQPLSEVSLYRFRAKVLEYKEEKGIDLIKDEFQRISKAMAADMGVLHPDPSENDSPEDLILVRMDSMEIEAHAKVMTRLEILYTTVFIMVRYLLRNKFGSILPESLSHYLEEDDRNKVLYYKGTDEKREAIQEDRVAAAVREMNTLQSALVRNFSQELLEDIPEYKVFLRVQNEQTVLGLDGIRRPKDKKDIPADSVQNPFDTTVTYRYKRGHHHGFVLNVAEAHDGNGNGIIIDADLLPNTASDIEMERKFIEKQKDGGPAMQVESDGAYESAELEELARKKNIDLVATSLTGKLPNDIFADFELDEEKRSVLKCPAGKVPVSNKYNEKSAYITAVMPGNCCASCPHRDECKARVNNKKNKSSVKVHVNSVRRARMARNLSTDKMKKAARHRNGVEGIMSVLRRKYGLDDIPVFGIHASGTWVWTSLAAYNLVKYRKYMTLKKQPKIQPVTC